MLNMSHVSSTFLYEWPVLKMCCGYPLSSNKPVQSTHRLWIHLLPTKRIHFVTQESCICKHGILLKSTPYKAYYSLQQTDHMWYTELITVHYTFTISFTFAQHNKCHNGYDTLMKSCFKSLSSNIPPILVLNTCCVKTKIHFQVYINTQLPDHNTFGSTKHVTHTINI